MIIDLKDRNPHLRECVHWIQVNYQETLFSETIPVQKIRIDAHQRVTIPSGIKAWIMDKNTAWIAHNKSGLASKKGIIVTANVIDADYTGEIHLGIENTSDEPVFFSPGDKITQFIQVMIKYPELEEVTLDQYKEMTSSSDRGEGRMGSTDKN
jgi:dUTPase